MTQILEMIAKWDHVGQGVFFLLVLGSIVGCITGICHYVAIWVRGWPPCAEELDDSEEDEVEYDDESCNQNCGYNTLLWNEEVLYMQVEEAAHRIRE